MQDDAAGLAVVAGGGVGRVANSILKYCTIGKCSKYLLVDLVRF
jgi:hypothetical protein